LNRAGCLDERAAGTASAHQHLSHLVDPNVVAAPLGDLGDGDAVLLVRRALELGQDIEHNLLHHFVARRLRRVQSRAHFAVAPKSPPSSLNRAGCLDERAAGTASAHQHLSHLVDPNVVAAPLGDLGDGDAVLLVRRALELGQDTGDLLHEFHGLTRQTRRTRRTGPAHHASRTDAVGDVRAETPELVAGNGSHGRHEHRLRECTRVLPADPELLGERDDVEVVHQQRQRQALRLAVLEVLF